MSQPLPTGGFKWVDVNPNEISELATRTDKVYLLEVDVSYPKKLHNPHNDLPFMCERMEINGVEKLVPSLRDKRIIRSIAMVKDLYRFQYSTKNSSHQ